MFAASFFELCRILGLFRLGPRVGPGLVQRALFPGKQENHVRAEPDGQRRQDRDEHRRRIQGVPPR
jgi:hypothetical protein